MNGAFPRAPQLPSESSVNHQALAESRFPWGKEHSRPYLKETDLLNREGCRQQGQDEGPSERGTHDYDGLDSRPACRASVSWALLFSLLTAPPHSHSGQAHWLGRHTDLAPVSAKPRLHQYDRDNKWSWLLEDCECSENCCMRSARAVQARGKNSG